MTHPATKTISTDVLIIGAGASGLFCAMTAGKNGRKVMVIDHANKAGKKILMSGGGRCNFTNYFVEPSHFIGQNEHFCKSALTRYTNWDFISLVEKHGIIYHERQHGQLFCDKDHKQSSKDILNMLLKECQMADVNIQLKTQVLDITPCHDNACKDLDNQQQNFAVTVCQTASNKNIGHNADKPQTVIRCQSLVIATGGLSIPAMGATGFGYQVAEQFNHQIVPTNAGLVPFTFTDKLGELFAGLSGISIDVIAFNDKASFERPMLFTHRGLSGFAMLQLSNYWQLGESIHINLLPNLDVSDYLLQQKAKHPKQLLRSVLADFFPKKLLLALQAYMWANLAEKELANIKDEQLANLGHFLNDWCIKPSGTEGYRTAEVTLGGVATDKISSKTMESQLHKNLYFIGEVLDVTGWLGGYNFQWAWASGFACGSAL